MSDWDKFNQPSWYNEAYFKTPEGLKYKLPSGETKAWSYGNPTGEFYGAKDVAKAWKKLFRPKNILDVGAGRGTFIAYARDAGVEAEGFDFSEWAVGVGRYPRCKAEWLKLHDATKPWPYRDNSFDLVVALDFYEHVYEEDLDFVMSEMLRVTKTWNFLQTAVTGSGQAGYVLKKGQPVPIEYEANAVAGHVTLRPKSYWTERLRKFSWRPRPDKVFTFCGLVDPAIIRNWLLNSIMVLEKVGA